MPEESEEYEVVAEVEWPQELLDAHRRNLEDIRTESIQLQEAKKQRMIDNGVPDEKHSI